MIDVLAQLDFDWSQWSVPFSSRWWQETTCSVLVGIACGVLGCFVVLRRMALIGDALSHAVLPGVVIAFMLTGNAGIGHLFLGALLAGLITAALIKLVSQYSRTKEDSAIGIVFTAFFALGIILISALPRGTHFDLKCFLFGDPLAVGPDDLLMMEIVAPLVIVTIFVLYHRLKITTFDPVVAAAMGISVSAMHYLIMGMLSATVVAGLKTTGVILVVAMVITPASAAYQLSNRLSSMLILSGVFGALAAAAGMSLAFVTNSPTGPAMVLAATMIFAMAMVLSPRDGVLFKILHRRRVRLHIDGEDCLKAVYRLLEAGEAALRGELASRTGLSYSRVAVSLRALRSQRLIETDGEVVRLTSPGHLRATNLVRAHRLWESYLAEEARADVGSIHDEAEYLEHAHELADEVDETLGFPERDPHGVVIPTIERSSGP